MDKNKDGWQVLAEYESDKLASGSEDEKRLRKDRGAAGLKKNNLRSFERSELERYDSLSRVSHEENI